MSRILQVSLLLTVLPLPVCAEDVHTPKSDSPEQKAIVQALRDLGDLGDKSFVVRDLKVADRWAWLSGDPKVKGGSSTPTKRMSALLHKDSTGWDVVDQPCTDKGCDEKQELARIRAAHSAAPAAIFPK